MGSDVDWVDLLMGEASEYNVCEYCDIEGASSIASMAYEDVLRGKKRRSWCARKSRLIC